MLRINKISSHGVIDYAAEELKKYFRMMMPEGGDVVISYAPEATDGFRLGLMQDAGIPIGNVENPELDDEIYIDCWERGGYILGDNPRSVLLSVYEYLRQNGCRWLYPGIDGEFIPTKNIAPVKYRHIPSCRYRGNCIEGSVRQDMLNDYIDFLPKVGLNTFMLQFKIPSVFYKRYYDGLNNEQNHKKESVSDSEMTAWTRATECEMAKRGIMLHSCGHGWTVDAFGIDPNLAWANVPDEDITDSTRQYLAMTDGKRRLFGNKPANTQFCMSNANARSKVVRCISDYAANHSNTDYLHIWLADASNNHCECEECIKKTPSDWYMMLMNELDCELTKRELKTRVVFIVYLDTTWAPTTERINNPDRFTMMIAPITRNYSFTFSTGTEKPKKAEFVRNHCAPPLSLEEYMLFVDDWDKVFEGSKLCFEYHFWKHMNFNPAGLSLAKRIYEDNAAYMAAGIEGVIECGTQRSFFPNGYAFYTHARTLFDKDLSLDDIKEDYFSHAYGDGWESFYRALMAVEELIPFEYVEYSVKSTFRSEEMVEKLSKVQKTVDILADAAKEYDGKIIPRVQRLSVNLIQYMTEYLPLLADVIRAKAQGDSELTLMNVGKFSSEFGKYEEKLFPYYDAHQATYACRVISRAKDQ